MARNKRSVGRGGVLARARGEMEAGEYRYQLQTAYETRLVQWRRWGTNAGSLWTDRSSQGLKNPKYT